MASASGCSERDSTPAASESSSPAPVGPKVITSVTWGLPSVTVPVLSRMTVSTRWAVSSASALLMRMPFSAPLPVPTMMATGVARPRAQGQEMTSTEMPMDSAKSNSAPSSSQTTVASAAMVITAGTKMDATLSASLAMGALEAEASSTNRMIWERVVSSPTRVARNLR